MTRTTIHAVTRAHRFAAAAVLGSAMALSLGQTAAAQSIDTIRQIGADDNPAMVAFECSTPGGPPIRMEMVLRRMAGQVWTYSSLERGVDCSSLSTGGITCMGDIARGRGGSLQSSLNDLLKDEGVRCTRAN